MQQQRRPSISVLWRAVFWHGFAAMVSAFIPEMFLFQKEGKIWKPQVSNGNKKLKCLLCSLWRMLSAWRLSGHWRLQRLGARRSKHSRAEHPKVAWYVDSCSISTFRWKHLGFQALSRISGGINLDFVFRLRQLCPRCQIQDSRFSWGWLCCWQSHRNPTRRKCFNFIFHEGLRKCAFMTKFGTRNSKVSVFLRHFTEQMKQKRAIIISLYSKVQNGKSCDCRLKNQLKVHVPCAAKVKNTKLTWTKMVAK